MNEDEARLVGTMTPQVRKSIECWLTTQQHGLLLHVPKRGAEAGFWQPMTGGIDAGETPVHATIREEFE